MVRIQTRESEKGQVQVGWGTKVFTDDGAEIKNISRITVDIVPDDVLRADIEVALSEFALDAEENFKIKHPITLQIKDLKTILFKDGTNWPAYADDNNSLIRIKDLFLSLLAIIHRDGGHYTEKVGIEKSYDDALSIFYNLLKEKENGR